MLQYYNSDFSSSSSTLRMDQTPPRRSLPSVPGLAPPPSSIETKRSSRPLPKIPRALTCKQCQAVITSNNVLFPSSKMPPNSRSFRGFSGKASLFTETYHVRIGKPGIQLMATGAHTMSEVCCGSCNTYLGWHIVRAHEDPEKWKEGKFLLELEHLHAHADHVAPLNFRGPQRSPSSDSGSDY